jgi:hypothetical protein
MQALGKLHESSKVTLVWTPGHQGIPDKEEADKLAKEGTSGVPSSQTTVIPFNVGKKLVKRHLKLQQQARWDTCTGYRQFKTLVRYLLPSRANELLAMSRLRLRAAVGLLTGHTTLRAHMYKHGLTGRQDCRLCGDDE